MPFLIETDFLMTGHFAKESLASSGMTSLGDGRIVLRSDQ